MTNILEKAQVNNYLEMVKESSKQNKIIDVHLHPIEVVYNNFGYVRNVHNRSIYSINKTQYLAPQTSKVLLKRPYEKSEQLYNDKFTYMKIKHVYKHIGRDVVRDHMKLSGVDVAILLPVESYTDSKESQIERIKKLYGGDKSFELAYCIPNRIGNADVEQQVKKIKKKYEIKMIKVHPNITGINLSRQSGVDRLEVILEACNSCQLPLIVHGGKTPALKSKNRHDYGVIQNLSNIDWTISKNPVIIAHSGAYGCGEKEVEEDVLPILTRMLSKYDNMLIDMSSLEFDVILSILNKIDSDRMLFGSDALYEAQWVSMAKLVHALKLIFTRVEDKLLEIASFNPIKYIL